MVLKDPAEASWLAMWKRVADKLGDPVEARFIVEHVAGSHAIDWTTTASNGTLPSHTDEERALAYVERRLAGEPLQYVLGTWQFCDLELKVDRRALIPRPETEEMASHAATLLSGRSRVLELGTGSGAIAIFLAGEHVHVTATDISEQALQLASENARQNEVANYIQFLQGSWFEAIPKSAEPFDLIITNPPYVRDADRQLLDPSVVDWEPHNALFAGEDGLDDLRRIVAEAPERLVPGGYLLTELDPAQANGVVAMALEAGFEDAHHKNDITMRPRWVVARMPGGDVTAAAKPTLRRHA